MKESISSFIFVFFLAFFSACTTQEKNTSPVSFEELRNYSFLDPNIREFGELFRRKYIVRIIRENDRRDYIIIDSVISNSINPADSNVFIYTDVGDKFTFLISLKLSPTLSRDTLLQIANVDPSNWINTAGEMFCSYRDSVLIVKTNDNYLTYDIDIIKILPGNKWLVDTTFTNITQESISHDFSQILICLNDRQRIGGRAGSVYVYDLLIDSTYRLEELGESNLIAKRRSRDTDIYLLKEINGATNIFKQDTQNQSFQITNFGTNIKIINFHLFPDHLMLVLKDSSDPTDIKSSVKFIYE